MHFNGPYCKTSPEQVLLEPVRQVTDLVYSYCLSPLQTYTKVVKHDTAKVVCRKSPPRKLERIDINFVCSMKKKEPE